MKKALIKTSFFIDTDIFQHVSQFEGALLDFFVAHGAEMERVTVLGAGDGNLFYTIRRMQTVIPVAQPKKNDGLSKKMMEVKNKVNPSLNKNTKPLVVIKEENRAKRIFNAGKEQFGKIRKISFDNSKPQGT